MEAQEIINLSINARMNHWPPHLGVNTDAEKIEYLATRLDEVATQIVSNDTLVDENQALREERDHFEAEAADLREKLKEIGDMTYEYRDLPRVP